MHDAWLTRPLSQQPVVSREMLVSLGERRSRVRALKLGQLLVAAGVVLQGEVDAVLVAQKTGVRKKLGEALVAKGATTAEVIADTLDHCFGPFYVDLVAYPVTDAALACLPVDIAHRFGVLPVDLFNDVLYVAAESNFSDDVLRIISCAAEGKRVSVLLANSGEQLQNLLYRSYVRPEAIRFQTEGPPVAPFGQVSRAESTLHSILAKALALNASDVHLYLKTRESGEVHLRVDGALTKLRDLSAAEGHKLLRQLEVYAGLNMFKPGEAREGLLGFTSSGAPISARASLMPSAVGTSVVLRIQDPRKFPSHVRELALPPAQERALSALAERPHGLFLLTGPTGSGKTTTLYTLLKQLQASGGKHIATAEDPVEVVLPGINQFKTTNFAHTLKLLLRQDPDVIMVGELRDADSALTAVNAALTGHLVLATLHANDSVSAVHRLLALGVPAVLASSSLVGVMSQRLVRQTCTHCAGEGCHNCLRSGYLGRKLVGEIIQPKESFSAMLTATSSPQEIRAHMQFIGEITLDDAIIDQATRGKTNWAEVRAKVSNPDNLPAHLMQAP